MAGGEEQQKLGHCGLEQQVLVRIVSLALAQAVFLENCTLKFGRNKD